MEEKQTNKFRSFLKNRIFYRVDLEEKNYVKQEILAKDGRSFRWLLIIIFILQITMLLYRILSHANSLEQKDIYYVICYASLATVCVIAFIISEYQASKHYFNGYFVTVALMVLLFSAWALGIAFLDSYNTKGNTNLTTYAYTLVALSALIILEPWVFILDSIIFATALITGIALMPSLTFYASVVVSAISISILMCIIAVVNFSRRIDAIKLQKEIIELNTVLNQQSNVDALTEIYNRRYLTDHINDALNLGITPSGVIMYDIDDFKMINDNYGHLAGDDCLKELGRITKEFVSNHEKSYAVRYGGEEFLIFIPRTDRMKLLKEAEEFRKSVEESIVHTQEGSEINLTISIGIALAKAGQNYSGLINKADTCLYSAKKSGKNKVCVE